MRLTITALCVFGTILAPLPAAAVDFPTRPVHVGAGPADFEKFIADEHVKWQTVIKEANIKIN